MALITCGNMTWWPNTLALAPMLEPLKNINVGYRYMRGPWRSGRFYPYDSF